MNAFLQKILAMLVVVVVLGSSRISDAYYPEMGVSENSFEAGCLDPGATMYAWVTKNNVGTEQVYIVDTDGDGMPNTVYCAGGSANTLNTTPSSGDCTGLKTLNSFSGCPFTIRVFMGSSLDDDDGFGNPIDCSGVTDPMLFFGGPGIDQFIGTVHGDFFNGGAGPDWLEGGGGNDFICANSADGDLRNVVYGDGGVDLVWGGPDPDVCHGGPQPDLVIAGVQDDESYGDTGNDWTHGASGMDTSDGGAGLDVVHTGESNTTEYVTANDSSADVVWAADDVEDELTADGPYPYGSDTCTIDGEDSGVCTDPEVNAICTTDHPFLVGARDAYDVAELYELEFQGAVSPGLQAQVWDDEMGFATRIVSLAVDPADCDGLTALLEFDDMSNPKDQYVAQIDLGTQPDYSSGAGGIVYATTIDSLEGPLSERLVDLAFDYASGLGGLTEEAEFVWVAGGALTPVGLVGPNGEWDGGTFDPLAYHMAFDDPDGGLFIAITADPNPDGAESNADLATLTAYHPPTELGTPHEDHILLPEGTVPFTVTNAGYGHFFTLGAENTNSCPAGEYPYVGIQRRDWRFFTWDEWQCPSAGPANCCAELGTGRTIDAITVPHYVVQPT